MNRHDFISDLRKKLKRLPKDEIANVTNYYAEYFADSNKSDEEVIKELGSTSSIASQILAQYALNDNNENKHKGNKFLIVILAILAAPIGLPLTIAAIITLFAFFIAIFSIFIAFVAAAFSLFIAGIITFAAGTGVILQEPSAAIFYIGAGLFIIGLSYIIGTGIKIIGPKLVTIMKEVSAKVLLKFKIIKNRKDN